MHHDWNYGGYANFGSQIVPNVAYVNPDGSKALIAHNGGGSAQSVRVVWAGQSLTYTLPARTSATFTWSGSGTGIPTTPPPAGGTGAIVSRANNKCLDVTNGSTADGTPAQMWACSAGPNQAWAGGVPRTPPAFFIGWPSMRTFWLDENFDREHATDGHSRYAAEVRRRLAEFAPAWGDFAPVTFAVVAWRLAVELEPGYVRRHPRIVSAGCARSPWDGSLTCDVTLVSPWPAQLTRSRQWDRDRGWRDWPQLFGQFVGPSEQDLTRAPHLRASLLVQAPVRLDDLPPAPAGPHDDVEATARRALIVLVRELNELLDPVLDQLETDIAAGS